MAPQGRMRDEPAEICPLTGSDSKPAPHPPSGGASGTFPQGGRLRLSKNACRGEHCSPVPVCLAKSRKKRCCGKLAGDPLAAADVSDNNKASGLPL